MPKAIEIEYQIRQSGRFLEALAITPEGYSWNGCHELVESWHVVGNVNDSQRQAITKELERRVADYGLPTLCKSSCECKE